jgi:hypothetical protein
MVLECPEEKVSLELVALAINLALNKRNAQLMCEGGRLRTLMQRAFHFQDALLMKCLRNIAQHPGPTKMLFVVSLLITVSLISFFFLLHSLPSSFLRMKNFMLRLKPLHVLNYQN